MVALSRTQNIEEAIEEEAPAEEEAMEEEAPAEEEAMEEEAPAEEEAAEEFDVSITIWADDTRAPILIDLAESFQATYGVGLIVEQVADINDQFPIAAPAGEGLGPARAAPQPPLHRRLGGPEDRPRRPPGAG